MAAAEWGAQEIMLDRFSREIYGEPEWSCGRASLWIWGPCLLYALLAAGLILQGMRGERIFFFPAAAALAFGLWRLWRLQLPVALVCRERLLLLASGRLLRGRGWREQLLEPVYFVTAYEAVAGFSPRWNEMYLGEAAPGGLVKAPVLLTALSRRDREKLVRRIEEKQQAGRPYQEQ